MKKRMLSLLLTALFGASALVGFAACGEPSDQGGPGDGGDGPEAPEAPEPDMLAPAFSDADVTLDLRTTGDEYALSDSLFGVFLEDINYASYALDDNLVANGSFENHGLDGSANKLYAWRTDGASLSVQDSASDGGIFGNELYKEYDGDYVNNNYAKVTVNAAGGSIFNSGYEPVPMAVEKDVTYDFAAFIRTGDYDGTLTVRVTDGTATYAEKSIPLTASQEWVKYKSTLSATQTAASGLSLELSFSEAGSLALDAVTFETNDSTVGIKNYLYTAIADLSPAFIRFPGGCIAEGSNDQQAFDWKNSIGAVAKESASTSDEVPAFTYLESVDGATPSQVTTYGEPAAREANTDLWAGRSGAYYEMEYAIGFYEYFLLCESLGAGAVPVISCGLSCQGGGAIESPHALSGRHGNGIQDYIQDAFDLIAFAKGDPASSDPNEAYWAQVRVNMGHEEPFEMDYLGIGNEQYGNSYYVQHYEKFLEAFAAQTNPLYDSVKIIVGNGMFITDCEDPMRQISGLAQNAANAYLHQGKIDAVSEYGVHDQHYYVNYIDLFTNTDLYDMYSRDPVYGYEVFVGEYSANSETTLLAAGSTLAGTNFGFGGTAWQNSWIAALSEAAMMTGMERNGDVVKLAAYAPMFAPLTGGRQWAVDMMYYTNTSLVKTTNYYVQQLFMKNTGDTGLGYALETYADGFEPTYDFTITNNARQEVSATINKFYYVATIDSETNDLIIKAINATGESIRMNAKIAVDATLTGTADVTELANADYRAVNTAETEAVSPAHCIIGGFSGNTLGYELKPYSAVAIRVHLG